MEKKMYEDTKMQIRGWYVYKDLVWKGECVYFPAFGVPGVLRFAFVQNWWTSSRSSLSNLHVFNHTHVSSSCSSSSCYIGEKLLVVWSSRRCGREDGGAIVWDESPNHNRKQQQQQQQWNCVKEGECLLSAVSTIRAPAWCCGTLFLLPSTVKYILRVFSYCPTAVSTICATAWLMLWYFVFATIKFLVNPCYVNLGFYCSALE
jgi:hypothetical protein